VLLWIVRLMVGHPLIRLIERRRGKALAFVVLTIMGFVRALGLLGRVPSLLFRKFRRQLDLHVLRHRRRSLFVFWMYFSTWSSQGFSNSSLSLRSSHWSLFMAAANFSSGTCGILYHFFSFGLGGLLVCSQCSRARLFAASSWSRGSLDFKSHF
jgi:hypothetical protein